MHTYLIKHLLSLQSKCNFLLRHTQVRKKVISSRVSHHPQYDFLSCDPPQPLSARAQNQSTHMTEWIIQYLDLIIRLSSDDEHYFVFLVPQPYSLLLLNLQNQGHTEVSRLIRFMAMKTGSFDKSNKHGLLFLFQRTTTNMIHARYQSSTLWHPCSETIHAKTRWPS